MRRLAIVVAALSVALVSTSADLAACGDKYARFGYGARLNNYRAIHKASILIYQAPKPNLKGEKELENALRRAGHNPVVVRRGTLSRVVDCEYDLVIALYPDAATVKDQLRALPAAPDVLPVLDNPSKQIAALAKKEYHSIISEDMSMLGVLQEVEHAMTTRLKNLSALSESGLLK